MQGLPGASSLRVLPISPAELAPYLIDVIDAEEAR